MESETSAPGTAAPSASTALDGVLPNAPSTEPKDAAAAAYLSNSTFTGSKMPFLEPKDAAAFLANSTLTGPKTPSTEPKDADPPSL